MQIWRMDIGLSHQGGNEMDRVRKAISNPKRLFEYMSSKMFYEMNTDWIPDTIYLKWAYKIKTKKTLHLQNPRSFTEKLQWIKIYDRNPEYTNMVDKYAVKKFVSDRIGAEYVIPQVGGPYQSFDEINFDLLPNQFVLKTTHDSGGIVVCKDKSKMNIAEAREKLQSHLQSNHWKKWREWAYKNVKPQIIAEEYMADDTSLSEAKDEQLTDYKFLCFNGKPRIMFVATDRFSDSEVKFDFFDMDFNHLPFRNQHPNAAHTIPCPRCFEQMKELAEKLSEGIPQVRIDFYNVNGRVYFGEYTLYHWAGLTTFTPDEWDYKIGEMLELPNKSELRKNRK